jgi:hypothetical protein
MAECLVEYRLAMRGAAKLNEQQKSSVARHLQISIGFMEVARTLLRSSADESDFGQDSLGSITLSFMLDLLS